MPMTNAVVTPVASRARKLALLAVGAAALINSGAAVAEVVPIDHDGYLEYQFRMTRNDDGVGSDQHLATWRGRASTFVWQPYILLLDGELGLTRSRNADSGNTDDGTIVTGRIGASAFARSTFPFRLYFESRDSRVDGDIFDSDFTTRNWGFLQQLASRRHGGRLALEYRASDSDQLSINGRTERRKSGAERWQLTGNRAFGRNDFRLLTSLRKLERELPDQTQNRKLLSLRHQYRGGLRFNIDDTLFYSDERLNLNGTEQLRRFLQFNGYSNWRPDTRKPLVVIGRVVAQAVEAGNGTTRDSHNYFVNGTATYQFSPRITAAASAGFNGSGGSEAEGRTGTFQRLRGSYRSQPISLGSLYYNWGGTLDLANRRDSNGVVENVQNYGASLNHGLSRAAGLGAGRQLQFGATQTAAARADTQDRQEQSLVHTAYATYSLNRGRTAGYLRFSASDRRLYGDRRDEFQLLSLQASSRMQLSRSRSLNGGFSFQYSTGSTPMMMDPATDDMLMIDNGSYTYSVNLSYVDRELFNVDRLSFLSELRYLSAEFRDDDPFRPDDEFDPSRSDRIWRNELIYRIGLLELRTLAEIRDINGRWNSQAFFSIRRYYGAS
jgi:hypothetical protein